MDRFSRGLPAGAVVALSLQPAGARLKLRLSASAEALAAEDQPGGVERVGPVLSWNPGTGSLQLSRQATQRLFHSLGGAWRSAPATTSPCFFRWPAPDRAGLLTGVKTLAGRPVRPKTRC